MKPQAQSSTKREEDRQIILQKLEKVAGIGKKTAQVFYDMGIRSLSNLVTYLEKTTTDDISKDFHEHGVNLRSGLIDKENMIDSAKKLGGYENEIASFTVSFYWDHQSDGSRQLLTKVYDPRNYGKDEPFYGEDPIPWVDWILKRANLLAKPATLTDLKTAEPPPEAEKPKAEEPPQAPKTPEDLEILSVDVFDFSPAQVMQKKLTAEIQFKISTSQLDREIKGNFPCQAKVFLQDLERGSIQLVSTGQIGLIPDQSHYQFRLDFPLPDLGHYKIQTNLCLLAPEASVAFYEGPRFKVTSFS